MKYKTLLDKVVVITGASSGVGKLAAEEFIAKGAHVVLAARSESAMKEHLEHLNVDAERAICVKTDVSDWEQVNALAEKAVDQFGRIDIWVNNAAVNLYGEVEQLEIEEIRRVIDVNLMGQIHGMKAALEKFKEQHYGTLINVSSLLGKATVPLQSVYAATEHGIVGFSSALREELMTGVYKDIDLSVILLPSLDTPFFIHAKSKLGLMPKPIPPVYDPKVAVEAILDCALEPQPEVIVGVLGKVFVTASNLMPLLSERYWGTRGIKRQLTNKPKSVEGNDNLFAPMPNTNYVRGLCGTTSDYLLGYAKKHPIQVAAAAIIPLFLAYQFIPKRRVAS